ncbi:hypothetical protein [uncultured Cocleimonas sp.]|uniref:hypothetical protein n=1 Tax=uncultured Cocleimonas sp. TaxID=1051587 RepID=UPI00263368FB|nr:hypothetical protein [uncultured Cocleimonas sp.]
MTRFKTQLLLAGCALCIASSGFANEKAVATEYFDGSTLAFDYKGNFNNTTISVSGPNGFNTQVFQERGTPTVNLSGPALAGKASKASLPSTVSLADGEYQYQITVATDKIINVTDTLDNGRGKNAKTTMNASETQSGSFRVKDGSIVTYTDIQESE